MGFAVILGETIASPVILVQAMIFGFMTGFLVLGVNMVLSGFVRQNSMISESASSSGTVVKQNDAVSFALVLGSFGLLFAALSGPITLAIALLALAMIVGYNAKLRRFRLLGSALVGGSIGLLFIYAGFAVGALTMPLAIFAMIAFLSSTGREIMKNIGGVMHGSTESAGTLGDAEGSSGSAVCFLLALAFSALPPVLGLVSLNYLPLAVIADIGFALTAYSIKISPTLRTAERNGKYTLLWMSFALLAFVIGVI
jgi:4-hydroxybenzoate polyprenyltransferase